MNPHQKRLLYWTVCAGCIAGAIVTPFLWLKSLGWETYLIMALLFIVGWRFAFLAGRTARQI